MATFGCKAFALLFDDIDPELSEADRSAFSSFAHAQVSVANEVYEHLGQLKFLFCPTGVYVRSVLEFIVVYFHFAFAFTAGLTT